MKKLSLMTLASLSLMAALTLTSCCRKRDEIWDDTKSAGRHMKRGISTLGGKHGDSRQVSCHDDFYSENSYRSFEDEFVPLSDAESQQMLAYAAFTAPQPFYTPGDPGSAIPGIDSFRDPRSIPQVAGIFRHIQFSYDSNLIKGAENLATIGSIGEYMRAHPNLYVFVEGHCDERGAEAYNLALGARRANAIRNMLIKEGVNPENIFTISYGKEKPVAVGHNEAIWSQNRRGEFKIYNHN